MKIKYLNIVFSILLSLVFIGCGSSSSSESIAEDIANDVVQIDDIVQTDESQSGTVKITINGEEVEWYSYKNSINGYLINDSLVTRDNDGDIKIHITASPDNDSNEYISFYLNFNVGNVTTGTYVENFLHYQTADDFYGHNLNEDFDITVTEASDDGTTVHVKGSFETNISLIDNSGEKQVLIEFDIDSTEIGD